MSARFPVSLPLLLALAASAPRPAAAAEAWAPPAPVTRTLPNGLEVAVFRDARLPIVQLQLLLPAGAVREPATEAGVASLTATLLTRGTTSRSAADFTAELERLGGALTANVTRDYATIGGGFLARDFDAALDLLGDAVLNPIFAGDEVERVRAEQVRQVIQARQNPATLAEDHLWAVVYPGHPYGRPLHGTLESLPGLRRQQVQQFHRDWWRPNGARLVVAGDVDPARALAAVESQFGSWSGASRAAAAAAPRAGGAGIRIIDVPGRPAAEIRIGRAGPPRRDADYAALQVANQVLGGSSSARLFGTVRGAQSTWSWQRDGSLAILAASTRPESAGVVVARLRGELARLGAAAPAPGELAAARKVLRNTFRLQFDQAGAVPAQWLAGRVFDLPDDHATRYLEAIETADVAPAARRWLAPEGVAVVVIGPAASMKADLEKLGPVEVVEPSSEPAAVALLPSMDDRAPTPEQLEQGRRAVEQALVAHGGSAKLRGIKDATLEAAMTVRGPQSDATGTVRQVRREPYQFVTTTEFGRARTTQVLNGARAWSLAGARGDSIADEDSLAASALRAGFSSDPVHVLLAASAPGARLARRGQERIGDRDADVIELVTPEGDRHILFLDPQSHRLVAAEQNERSLMGNVSVRRVWSDHRTVEGILWPWVEEREINGEKAMTLVTKKIDFNSGVDESMFKRAEPDSTSPAWRRR